jgi:hypothetical protein
MSISKAEAEAAGWRFVHADIGEVRDLGDGISQAIPASYRAEKYVSLPGRSAQLVNEQAESEQLLLERIGAFEGHLVRVGHGMDVVTGASRGEQHDPTPNEGVEGAEKFRADYR